MTLWLTASQGMSRSYQVWLSYALWQLRYNDFRLSRDLARPRHQKVMRFYVWNPLIISHYPEKFGVNWRFVSGDMTLLVVDG